MHMRSISIDHSIHTTITRCIILRGAASHLRLETVVFGRQSISLAGPQWRGHEAIRFGAVVVNSNFHSLYKSRGKSGQNFECNDSSLFHASSHAMTIDSKFCLRMALLYCYTACSITQFASLVWASIFVQSNRSYPFRNWATLSSFCLLSILLGFLHSLGSSSKTLPIISAAK